MANQLGHSELYLLQMFCLHMLTGFKNLDADNLVIFIDVITSREAQIVGDDATGMTLL